MFSCQLTFFSCLTDKLSNEISSNRNPMRRHTLDPDSIRKQIKSVFTSPTRRLLNFTNNNNNNGPGIINFGRRTRRSSVPEKKNSDKSDNKSDNNSELDTIHEVSLFNLFIDMHVLSFALLLFACC
jgi:hypothetical protein